jgi:hypothetical protein
MWIEINLWYLELSRPWMWTLLSSIMWLVYSGIEVQIFRRMCCLILHVESTWRWRQRAPSKPGYISGRFHGVTSQNTVIFKNEFVRQGLVSILNLVYTGPQNFDIKHGRYELPVMSSGMLWTLCIGCIKTCSSPSDCQIVYNIRAF